MKRYKQKMKEDTYEGEGGEERGRESERKTAGDSERLIHERTQREGNGCVINKDREKGGEG